MSFLLDAAINTAGLVLIAGMASAGYYLWSRYDGFAGVKEAVTTRDADLLPTLKMGICAPALGAYQGVSSRMSKEVASLRVDSIKED